MPLTRLEIRPSPELRRRIDRWRGRQDGIPPASEAARLLLEFALDTLDPELAHDALPPPPTTAPPSPHYTNEPEPVGPEQWQEAALRRAAVERRWRQGKRDPGA
jgi:hypothetical protein